MARKVSLRSAFQALLMICVLRRTALVQLDTETSKSCFLPSWQAKQVVVPQHSVGMGTQEPRNPSFTIASSRHVGSILEPSNLGKLVETPPPPELHGSRWLRGGAALMARVLTSMVCP